MSLVAEQKAKSEKSLKRLAERIKALVEVDPQLSAMMPDPAIAERLFEQDLSVEQVIDGYLEGYAERPALGERAYEIEYDPATETHSRKYLPEFETISFGEYRSQISALAAAWGNEPGLSVKQKEYVAILGFASIQFSAVFLAAIYNQAIPVPLQSTTSGADLSEIFGNVNPSVLAATRDDLIVATELAIEHGNIPVLLVFDYDERVDSEREIFDQARKMLDEAGSKTRLITYQENIEIGKQYAWTFPVYQEDGEERTAFIIHSSGATGKPKGAMMAEPGFKFSWDARPDRYPSVMVMFAPLNHGLGIRAWMMGLRKGSLGYFTLKPDMSSLFEDIRIARPTQLSFLPRVFETIHQHFQNDVAARVKQGENREQAEQDVMQEMRHSFLGDRLLQGSVGSAPTSPAVRDFMRNCFDIHLSEGFSNTETGAGSLVRDNVIQRPNVIDYKLDDVPELGYFKTDKPYPRGELLFKTKYQVKGYLHAPEATAALTDAEGYIRSGDIVEEREPDYLVVIDRRKDVLKLSQGEYVAVGPLGTFFESGSAIIHQIYVYGNSMRSYVLAVVVPDEEAAKSALGEGYSEAELKTLLRAEMQRVAQENDLKAFEVPRDFVIETEPFSQANGLLSSVRKRLRPALKVKYGPQLEAIYEEHEQASKQQYEALKDPDSNLSTLEKLVKLTEITLGLESVDADKSLTFNELGGDSLGAVTYSLSIEDVFGVSLGADVILSPTGSVGKWAREIEERLDDSFIKPTFASIHGEGETVLRADALELEKFLGAETMAGATQAEPVVDDEKTVLVTGGNGFLGHYVVLQWMERLAPKGGKVVALIRAKDNDSARKRLNAIFTESDPELKSHYEALAANHLEVIAGDIGESLLGLSGDAFAKLAGEVDRIVHVGALVNHRLAYEHLFGPNVAGTAEIIRLAVTERKKSIDFVSTEATLRFTAASPGESNETALPLDDVPVQDERYAGGYATSKWAGEILVRKAHLQFGLPVNVLRGNMMLAHQSYRGEINYADTFTRILYSIAITGLAPRSFYVADSEGNPQYDSYDGSPVNVVAAAVVSAANFKHNEFRSFNIHNYHQADGCHFDAFVNWIESAGYAITRIDNYREWLERIEAKLKSLPEDARQHSALEIMGSFATQRGGEGSIEPASDNFRQLVKASTVGPDIPHLDEKFIHKCMQDIAERYGI